MISLEYPRPYDPRLTLIHLETSSFGAVYRFLGEGRVARLVHIDGRPLVLEFDVSLPVGPLNLDLADSPGAAGTRSRLPAGLHDRVCRLASFLWGFDDDLAACYSVLGSDPLIGPLVSQYEGLRIVRAPDLYEALLVAVSGQQVSVASAQSIRKRLMSALGDRLEIAGQVFFGYPRPRQLLDAGPHSLAQLGVSRQKTRYLLAIADLAAQGALGWEGFLELDDEQAMARLMEIPGVGRWTAEIALMRGLGRRDVFCAGDLGLAAAVQQRMGLEQRPREADLRAMAERWHPFRSYAAFYLWMALQSGAFRMGPIRAGAGR